MWKCPICKTDNQENRICEKCGFDETTNYLRYKTFSRIAEENKQKTAERVMKDDALHYKKDKLMKRADLNKDFTSLSRIDKYILLIYIIVAVVLLMRVLKNLITGMALFGMATVIMALIGISASVVGIIKTLSKRYYIGAGMVISLTGLVMAFLTWKRLSGAYYVPSDAFVYYCRYYLLAAFMIISGTAICILTRKQAKSYE